MIKDNIQIYQNLNDINHCCYICSKNGHFYKKCPFVHYIPDKENICKKYFINSTQRRFFKRREMKSKNCLTKLRNFKGIDYLIHNEKINYSVVLESFKSEEKFEDNQKNNPNNFLNDHQKIVISPKHPKFEMNKSFLSKMKNSSKMEINDSRTISNKINLKNAAIKKKEYIKSYPNNDQEDILYLKIDDKELIPEFETYFPHNNLSYVAKIINRKGVIKEKIKQVWKNYNYYSPKTNNYDNSNSKKLFKKFSTKNSGKNSKKLKINNALTLNSIRKKTLNKINDILTNLHNHFKGSERRRSTIKLSFNERF